MNGKKLFCLCVPFALAAVVCCLPSTTLAATVYNFDVDNAGGVLTYSGLGVVPGDTGTTWNSLPIDGSASGFVTFNSIVDSQGNATALSVTMDRNNGDSLKVWTDTTNGNPTPNDLMADYTFWDPWTVQVNGIPNGKYHLYVMGHGDNVGQTSTFEVDAANGGAIGATTDNLTDFRDIFQAGAEGNTYLKLPVTVTSNSLVFQSKNPNGGYINGFQIAAVPEPASLGFLALFGCAMGMGRKRS